MSALSPLLLQAQITPPSGGGSFGLADTTRLENPFQAPMWLDEIRFRLPTNFGKSWSSFRVELKLGEIPLTKGFVPISLFGKALNDSRRGGELDFNRGIPDSFTWKLPKPLFIPSRELLRPTMYFDSYSDEFGNPGESGTVTIAYACRPLARGTPTPKTLQVPWVTYYKPDFMTVPGAVEKTDQSTPADLYNPWDQDLHVQRFVGRLMCQDRKGENDNNMGLASAIINLDTGLPTYGTFVSAQDSFNNILIRDNTPFAHVFDFVDRAWTMNCVLPPKGFYLFTVDRLWSGYENQEGPITATVGIGMTGWREVHYL